MKKTVLSILFVFSVSSLFAAPVFEVTDCTKENIFTNLPVVLIQKGDHPDYKNTEYDDREWTVISLPNDWVSIFPEKGIICWYRIHVKFPDELRHKALGISLGVINDTDEVYFNGQLIGRSGIMGDPKKSAYDKKRVYEIPAALINPGQDNIIAVRIKTMFLQGHGASAGDFVIAPFDNLKFGLYINDLIQVAFISVYLVFVVYFLFFYLSRRQEWANLFFSIFSFDISLYFFMRTQLKYYFNLDFFMCKKIEYISLALLIPLFLEFVTSYFKQKRTVLHKIIYVITLSSVLLYIPTSTYETWSLINHYVVQPSWILIVGLSLYYIIINLKKNLDARYMLGGLVVLLLCGLNDTLVDRSISFLPRLSSYGFIFFIGSLGIILNRSFVRLYNEVEDLNVNLEQKVKDRTDELQHTLTEVQTLKNQQDGDYFLTSLLMKPLGKTTAQSGYIRVKSLLEQKKKFSFKNRNLSIGGDLIISENVMLHGRRYIAFLNCDAMGKSIQGAGGALVTGVIYHSYHNRTRLSSSYSRRYPERWLKECYLDLQNVFESFDGSMLVSMVTGLVDEETGFMYYVNAEHPWVTVYRDGRASFIEEDFSLRKIGMYDNRYEFCVKTYQMTAGDTVIVGSDGRDDILTGIDKSGTRIINEDEHLFLKHVESGQGEIFAIKQSIESSGELTDDLSLLSISFAPEPKAGRDGLYDDEKLAAAAQKIKTAYTSGAFGVAQSLAATVRDQAFYNLDCAKAVVMLDLKMDNLQAGAVCADAASEIYPGDNELLYLVALISKRAHDFERALDFGERLRLREPKNTKNLVNLADVYRMTGKKDLSLQLVNRVLELNPDNKTALQLKLHLLHE